MIDKLLARIAPYFIRLVSSSAAKKIVLAVVRNAFDRVESKLMASGQREAARLLQLVENELFDDPTPLIGAAQTALMDAAPVMIRSQES